MKKFLFSLIFLLVSYVGFSQKGLSYQAVILDPNKIEVPGQDISGQPLVNGDVWMKFSIYNGSTLQFEEVHKTKTDNYGLVNLLIGSVSSGSFNSLVWDSSQKSLYVYASFDQGGSYTKISEQKLTYNPYALFAETAGKLGATLPISGGGTGATTAADAIANLGLDQVNNTSDAAKPVSTATQIALNLKANAADVISSLVLKANTADMTTALAAKADTGIIKAYVDSKIGSTNNTSNQSSSSNISSAALAAKADTSFVLAQVAAATIVDADATTKGKIQLAGDLAGTAAAPAVPGLALKANVTDLVTLTSTVNTNTASITSNSAAIISEATAARAAELVLTNSVAANTASITSNTTNLAELTTTVIANTASITANTNAITLKAPIASPVFTGTVAIGTANPSAGAVLDITSTSKGLLLPRLTFAQKSAIVSPEAGLILWCSDCGTNGELQVYNGTNFVNMVGANAQFALPSVTSTASATSITSSALTSGGVIDADGGAFVTARGVVWNTSTNPTISLSTKTTDGTGIGTFSSAITGLTSGVTYYVRAYATNSVGTKYGPEISVNTAQAVATLASTTLASSIGANTATSGGNITYNGGATVTVSGLVWSTTSTPTTSDSKTTDGTVNGSFTSNITGLTPGTLYYVRSYATNSVGTSYGAQTSFTTLNTASISATTSVTSITSTSATSGGTITTDGGAAVLARGIVWGTSTGSSTFSVTTGSGTGTFVSNLTGLSPATTYYVRSFATNSVGTVYGTETSFTTIAVEPTVQATVLIASITGSSATSGGTITSNGGATVTASGVVWSTTSTPTIALLTKTTNGAAIGTYTSTLTGLAPATLYYVRAYATNSIGTAYGPERSFTTLAIAPSISGTSSATSITSSTATAGGTITSDGGASVTSRGVVYGTSSGSSTYSSTSGTSTGTFTSSLTGLTPATTYYVRAYATNSVGTVYGTETSFTTSAGPASNAMITTEPSGAAAGTAFATQPVVRITDASGNTVTTSTVNVVASIASGTGGALSGTTTVTAVNGVATFTDLVLSGTAGNFTLTFTPTSLTAATSNSFALSFGAASKVIVTTQPSGAFNGIAFSSQPVVRITDAGGNTITGSTANVVVSIASGTGTLSGTTTVAAVNGVATFTDLVLSGTAGNFTLTFTPTSLTAATSNSFALSFGAASKVIVTTQPSGAFNGIAFSSQPVVRITDAGGNTITGSTANVVVSIASGTGTLSGTTTVAAVNGVATFTNLKITGTGNHTLTFTAAGGLTTATSNTVNVAELGCAQGGTCATGETGPGGGTVFYYSAAGFNCGASFTSTGSPTYGQCHYLEYAPAGWNGPQGDPYAYWSPNTTTSVGATSTAIGSGYKNSELMRVNDGTIYHPDGRPYAGAYIRSKTLGGKSDWYLPSKDELNQLCKWARGLPATTPDIEADGTAGTLSSINNPSTGWIQDHYWSSSENAPSKAYSKDFRGNTVYLGKIWNFVIRPIRAF